MSPTFDLTKDINAKKAYYYKMRGVHCKWFNNVTDDFIEFIEKSGERTCECEGAYPKKVRKTLRSGKRRTYYVCSVCGGKFYKIKDFSFSALVLGKRGSGKTTLVLTLGNLIHIIDKHKRIVLWQAPEGLIAELHSIRWCMKHRTICERAMGIEEWNPATSARYDENGRRADWHRKGRKHKICEQFESINDCERCPFFKDGLTEFIRVESLNDIQWNDVLIIDEGIISLNAKEALTKGMIKWEKFIAVLRHQRVVLLCLFQRVGVIRAVRESADMIIYKRLPQRVVDNENVDKFLIKNGETFVKLRKYEAIITSDHHMFEGVGRFVNHVPEFYTDEISMSWDGDMEFLDERAEEKLKRKREQELVIAMTRYIIDRGLDIENRQMERGVKAILWGEFLYHDPFPRVADITRAIDYYYAYREFQVNDIFSPTVAGNEPDVAEKTLEVMGVRIHDWEMQVFNDVVNGKSMTAFNEEPYKLNKNQVRETFEKVGRFLLLEREKKKITDNRGDEAESFVKRKIWEEGGWAIKAVGSGGTRHGIPAPDLIVLTPDGELRVVQVKMRDTGTGKEFFKPTTFDSEFHLDQRTLEIIKKNKGRIRYGGVYLYAVPKDCLDADSGKFIEDRLYIEDNKKTLVVDWRTGRVRRQETDIDDIKTPKIREFLQSNDPIMTGIMAGRSEEDKKEMTKMVDYLDLEREAEQMAR